MGADRDRPYDEVIDLIDEVRPDEVVVIACSGSTRTALWGELFSAAAQARGASGVVCDGYTRDRDKVLAHRHALGLAAKNGRRSGVDDAVRITGRGSRRRGERHETRNHVAGAT